MQLFYSVMMGLGGVTLAGIGIMFLCGGVQIMIFAFNPY